MKPTYFFSLRPPRSTNNLLTINNPLKDSLRRTALTVNGQNISFRFFEMLIELN